MERAFAFASWESPRTAESQTGHIPFGIGQHSSAAHLRRIEESGSSCYNENAVFQCWEGRCDEEAPLAASGETDGGKCKIVIISFAFK